MKKLVSLSLVIVLLFSLCLPVAATQGSETVDITYRGIRIIVNGTEITPCDGAGNPTEPFIMNKTGSTYLPVRAVANALGLAVAWDNATNTVTLNSGAKPNYGTGLPAATTATRAESITYRNIRIVLNGQTVATSAEPFIMNFNSTTYLPLRAVAAALGLGVNWDGTTSTVTLTSGGAVPTPPVQKELSAEQIYQTCSPAVFYIEVYDASGTATASGSGFFIDSNGTAVTNYHVIEGASSAKILTSDTQTVYKVAGVYDYNIENDWAVIKVECSGTPYLRKGSADTVVGGATVYAIGSPKGLDNTISQGLISNPNRIIDGISHIQTSASISHGSSGGALINKYGEVIGITTATYKDGQNLNFALPISVINGYTHGKVTPLAQLCGGNQELSFAVLRRWIEDEYTHTYTSSGNKVYVETEYDDGDYIEFHLAYYPEYNEIAVRFTYEPYNSSYSYTSILYLSETEVTHDSYFYVDNSYSGSTMYTGSRYIYAPTFSSKDLTPFRSFDGPYSLQASLIELSSSMMDLSLYYADRILNNCESAYGGTYAVTDFGFTGR